MIKVAGLRLTCAGVADGFRAKILRSLNVAAFGEGKGGAAAVAAAKRALGGLRRLDSRVAGPCHPLQYTVCIPLRSAGRGRS